MCQALVSNWIIAGVASLAFRAEVGTWPTSSGVCVCVRVYKRVCECVMLPSQDKEESRWPSPTLSLFLPLWGQPVFTRQELGVTPM